MKQLNFYTQLILFATFVLSFASCTKEEFSNPETPIDKTTKHTIPMKFIGDVVGFNQTGSAKGEITRSETSSSWKDGDKIYITFYNGSVIVPGEATYNTASGWTVSYDGNLTIGANLKCQVRYFVNAILESSSLITLDEHTEIYEDLNGSYTFAENSIMVQATLTPKTGRIRFTGNNGDMIHIIGITTYTTFATSTNTFSTTGITLNSTVGSNGSTPYIYGYISSSDRSVSIVGRNFAYNRNFESDVLKTGESGYMAIPSESSHNYWKEGMYMNVGGVDFKMIPVIGLSSGFYLIGETEVTRKLYNAVKESSSLTTDLECPMYFSSYTYLSFNNFIETLNYKTNLKFAMPTVEQWTYAAKGGNKSRGYTYSGSNNPGDVAWYSANSKSNSHPVKQLTPNELGIYDMSGNVSELIKYDSSRYYMYGGDYSSTSDNISTTSYSYSTSDIYGNNIGLRLILTFK